MEVTVLDCLQRSLVAKIVLVVGDWDGGSERNSYEAGSTIYQIIFPPKAIYRIVQIGAVGVQLLEIFLKLFLMILDEVLFSLHGRLEKLLHFLLFGLIILRFF